MPDNVERSRRSVLTGFASIGMATLVGGCLGGITGGGPNIPGEVKFEDEFDSNLVVTDQSVSERDDEGIKITVEIENQSNEDYSNVEAYADVYDGDAHVAEILGDLKDIDAGETAQYLITTTSVSPEDITRYVVIVQ